MRAIWITNVPFAYHNQLLGKDPEKWSGASWINAAYDDAKNIAGLELHIITVAPVNKVLEDSFDGNKFYILPGGNMSNYDIKSESNIKLWNDLKKRINPDFVLIWGMESRFSYVASNVFRDIPIYVYIQGVLKSIVSNYFDGIPNKFRMKTPRDIADRLLGLDVYHKQIKQLDIESKILENARGVIVENNWCEFQCKETNPNLQIIKSNLPIQSSFYKTKWSLSNMRPYSVFTNAGGATIKGHHILFKALGIVKKQYPEVKLFIPGVNYMDWWKGILRKSGYAEFLETLYKKYSLQENIEFLGYLNPTQMAEQLSKCNVYAMPSLAENHSSSLIEALVVGAPCVSSLVGGTAELIRHGDNGFLYNELEAISLAGYIMKIFANREMAKGFSESALQIRETRTRNFVNALEDISNMI